MGFRDFQGHTPIRTGTTSGDRTPNAISTRKDHETKVAFRGADERLGRERTDLIVAQWKQRDRLTYVRFRELRLSLTVPEVPRRGLSACSVQSIFKLHLQTIRIGSR